MKTTNLLLKIVATGAIIFLISCKKDDFSLTPSGTSNTVQQGNWRVTFFEEDGNNETSHFSGYQLEFNNNGTVVASGNGSDINGNWSTGSDDSHVKLVLDFGASTPFDELNDDWHVINQSENKIQMEDVSGGNGGTDYLTLEKN